MSKSNHLSLSMPQIRRERAVAAVIVRALRPFSPRMAAAILELAAAKDAERRAAPPAGPEGTEDVDDGDYIAERYERTDDSPDGPEGT